MLIPKTLKFVLKKYALIDAAGLKLAQTKADKTNKTLEEVLVTDNIINENDLYEKAGDYLQIPYISLKGKEIKKEVLNLIPGPVAGTQSWRA
jgi:glutaredoxin